MNETAEVDYDLPKLSKPKWVGYLLGLFLAAFIMYFPIASKIDSQIKSAATSIPGCPISYDDLSFSLFLPKFVVKNLQAPASCFNQRGAPMVFDEAYLYIRGLSFSPFGPHFKLATQLFGNPFEALISVGIGGASVNLHETLIDLAKISPMLPAGLKLGGKAQVDLLAEAGKAGLQEMDLRVTSKDLVMPAQTIQAFAFSRMDLNNLLLKAKMGPDGVINVEEIILGDAQSPIRANFKGTIKLDKRMPDNSTINMVGEVAFSKTFLDQYSIIGMVMNQFDKKDDFYQIQLTGRLSRPVPSSPRK